MLNQINQFIRIQTRNVGDFAVGCPIDDSFNMIGGSLRPDGLRWRDYGLTSLRDRFLAQGGNPTGWLKRLHRLRHWHAQLERLQLHWQLQQR